MIVKYVGPALDFSGYGEATRHHLGAFEASDVDVSLDLVRYSAESSDFGDFNTLVSRLNGRPSDGAKIQLLHTTPDQFKNHLLPDMYHVGFMYWETDKIPEQFAEGLMLCDEIWTASEANKEAIIKGGVTKPIYVFPQAIQTDRKWGAKYEIPGMPEDKYMFYSIFEWTDRKNPEALLKAYWKAFQNDENVGLLLKTYSTNFTSQSKRFIRNAIHKAKSKSGLPKFPPVYVYLDLMDRSQVDRIHQTGDCFVSAHRGEGWGVPQVEAALAGNLIISTGYGGCHEYFTDQTAIILPYTMKPLKGMEHSRHWYTEDQRWAEVDQKELTDAMRRAYEGKSDKIAAAGQKFVQSTFNLKTVGEAMAKRLRTIERTL